MQRKRSIVPLIAHHLGLAPVADDWAGVDAVMPLLDRMRADGAVVLIKLDGERRSPGDAGPFTLAILGKAMGDDPLRRDVHSLEDGLSDVILEYAQRFWGYRLPL